MGSTGVSALGLRIAIAVLAVTCIYLQVTNPTQISFAFTADQLTIPSLVDDVLFNPRFSISDWVLPDASLIADALVYLPIRAVVASTPLALLLFSFTHFLLLFLGVYLVCRFAFEDATRRAFALVCFLAMFLCLAAAATVYSWPLLELAFVPFGHAGALILALVAFPLYRRAFEHDDWRFEILAAILSFLGILSDVLFVAFFSVPYLVYLVATGPGFLRLFKPYRFLVAQVFVGVAARYALTFSDAHDLIVPHPVPFKNLTGIFDVEREAGRGMEAYFVGSIIACMALVLFYSARRIFMGPRVYAAPFDRAAIFLALAALSNFCAMSVLWTVPTPMLARYGPAFQAFPLVLAAIAAARFYPDRGHRGLRAVGASLAATGVAAALWLSPPSASIDRLATSLIIQPETETCFAALGLKSGVAGYWLARPLSMGTEWRYQVNQFTPTDPVIFLHGTNRSWFSLEMKTGEPIEYNFIVTNGLSLPQVVEAFGPPSTQATCGPYQIAVYADAAALTARILARPTVRA